MTNPILNPNNYFFNPHCLIYFIPSVLVATEAIFVFWQNKKSMVNISFALLLTFANMWITGSGIAYCVKYEPVAFFWSSCYAWMGVIFVTPTVYLFSVIHTRHTVKNKMWLVYLNFAIASVLYIVCISSTHLVHGVWRYPWGFYTRASTYEGLFLVWFYSLMTLSFRNFVMSYKREKMPMQKRQTKLVIIAFVIAFIGSVDFLPNFGIPLYPIGGITMLTFATIIAYTIVRYKLMEIETVVHKTIAWFITSVALVIPLAALLYFTKRWCANLSVCGTWSYFIAALVCFLFFVKTLHPRVDAFFHKGRAYLGNTLNKFSAELVHLRSIEEVVNKITDTITEALHAGKVAVLLDSGEAKKLVASPFLKWVAQNDRVIYSKLIEIHPRYEHIRGEAKEYFDSAGAEICIPLVLNEELIGIVNVGRKKKAAAYRAFELHFLANMKNQMTIAVSNSLVYGRVEELVKRRTAELVQAQKQLIQAEKLATVGTLASGIAHEINNPLTSIVMHANVLSNAKDEKNQQESIRSIEESAARCSDIVKKLLTYAREPRGRKKREDIDLEKSLKRVISFLGYQLKRKNIVCNIKADDSPFVVNGYKDELEQVFTNLILNAKDAIAGIQKTGKIIISLSKDSGRITINIEDDGCGIPQEHISKIFDPFFTTKETGKGTGLGLSICQSIIEQHKGTISVESRLNHGSTFIILLPAVSSVTK